MISSVLDTAGYFNFIEDVERVEGFKRVIDDAFNQHGWLTLNNNRYLNFLLGIEPVGEQSTPDYRSIEITKDNRQ